MSPGITELQLTDVSTISIPTDAILILSLLIVFALIGYFLNNILDHQTNQVFVEEIDNSSNLELVTGKLEGQLALESARVHHAQSEKPSIKKLNFLRPSQCWGIGSLVVLTIGGTSLLRNHQSVPTSYKRVDTSQMNIKTENKTKKSLLSMAKMKSSTQTQIKRISYLDPLFSTNDGSKNNNFLQVNARQKEDFFSF